MPHTASMTPALAAKLVLAAAAMNRPAILALQKERLQLLLNHARSFSPLLREKYRGLPDKPDLAEIPPMTRFEGTSRFEDWLCDRQVTGVKVREYMADINNALSPFLGRYRVLATSGTTDVPLVLLRDDRHNQVNAALMSARFLGGSKIGGIRRLAEPGCKTCGIMAAGGHHSSYLSFLRMEKAYRDLGFGDRIKCLPVDTGLGDMIAALNEFQPEMLAGYPSNLQVLALAQKAGRLSITPLAIFCSAEYLADEALALLEDAFRCPVMNNYCSTEAGEVAMLCAHNRMHVNDDWIIVEPVDADNRPVAPGTLSDGVLITNLANLVQPVIRYRISDRVRLRHEPCACGLPFPVMEIEGRKEDILEFRGEAGPVLIPPSELMVSAMHIDGCVTGQFIQRAPELLEIRLECLEGLDRKIVAGSLLDKIRIVMAKNGAANVRVALNDEPVIRGKSGKVRCAFSQPFQATAG